MDETTDQPMRDCGSCHACCIDLIIGEKPAGVSCQHLTPSGCAIYATRSALCRAYNCLWRIAGEERLDDWQRPDRIGCILSIMRASALNLLLKEGHDWLLAVARPCNGHEGLADRTLAFEAIRRVLVSGMHVFIDEPLASGHIATLLPPLRPATPEFVALIQRAVNVPPQIPQTPAD
ncbi:MAG: hypothetical protein IMZ55_04870 [Acidobacteria bacterium]|nr:hypothetical protein [Acidobacteriota bacterium]